jgi:nucleoside-diphosphate-sugar epimerase
VKVFVTGVKGYVGNVLIDVLKEKNHTIIGCDTGFYPQEFLDKKSTIIECIKKDIRDLESKDLEGCEAVIHLAGLSNDPLGEINPNLTNEINYKATIHLAELAKENKIKYFVFSSSCSIYGANSDIVDENSQMAPLTAYAKSKVDSENKLLELKDDFFSPIILRNATVYGISSSQRLDIVVNNLVASVVSTGKIKLLSDGSAWRPLLHVEDMARAFEFMITSDIEKVAGQIFNVGSNNDNYKVREIAEMIGNIIPKSKIMFAEDASKDNRSYKVNFDKIEKLGFRTKWTLEDGIKHIYETMINNNFSENDFNADSYFRVKYLKRLLDKNILDSNLRYMN